MCLDNNVHFLDVAEVICVACSWWLHSVITQLQYSISHENYSLNTPLGTFPSQLNPRKHWMWFIVQYQTGTLLLKWQVTVQKFRQLLCMPVSCSLSAGSMLAPQP